MRFIHIADVHLGAQPDAGPIYSENRPQELWDTFEHVIRVCEEERTDLLLIAGDLFHRQPLLRELREVDYLFSRLTHTKVVLIAGNHDYIRRDSYYRTFRWSENVYPLFGRTLEYVDFPELGTAVYDRKALSSSGFCYIALGHIHKPQALEKDRIIYAGALEPVDRNDTGPHGYIRGEVAEAGVRTQWIPCAGREYIHLEIHVDGSDTEGSVRARIRKCIDEQGNENIYKITLIGKRNSDVKFDANRIAGLGNILETVDETCPAYDIMRLLEENRENLLGQYISRFAGCREGSLEYEALCEGIDVLLAGRD